MSVQRWRHRVVGSIGILTFVVGTTACQNGEEPSTIGVIRQQLGSIADQACDSIRLTPKSTAGLSVIGAKNRSLAENAFIRALQNRGINVYMDRVRDSSDALITVNILSDHAVFEQVRHEALARTIQTEVEVRAEFRTDRPAMVVGTFRRSARDTVSQREADFYLNRSSTGSDEQATFFQRLLGPLIVLAGGIIVVYLFFTVRS